jgi:hypothetical protein
MMEVRLLLELLLQNSVWHSFVLVLAVSLHISFGFLVYLLTKKCVLLLRIFEVSSIIRNPEVCNVDSKCFYTRARTHARTHTQEDVSKSFRTDSIRK